MVFKSGNDNIAKRDDIRQKIRDNKWQGLSFTCPHCGSVNRCSASKLKTKKYCTRECRARVMSARRAQDTPNWRGGRRVKGQYVYLYMPNHPFATKGVVLEHRFVMEQSLGRYLTRYEIVHHKNEIKHDNRLKNLQLTNRAEHRKIHRKNIGCIVDKCDRDHGARKMCSMHYKRWLRKNPVVQ